MLGSLEPSVFRDNVAKRNEMMRLGRRCFHGESEAVQQAFFARKSVSSDVDAVAAGGAPPFLELGRAPPFLERAGPKRRNPGRKGTVQTQRQAEKRKLERAKRGLKRMGRPAKTSWEKRCLGGKQMPLGINAGARAQVQRARAFQKEASAKTMALQVEAEQAGQLAKEAMAKAAAMELEKEAALQDVKEATRQVAASKRREADALNYADSMYKRQGKRYVEPPCLA